MALPRHADLYGHVDRRTRGCPTFTARSTENRNPTYKAREAEAALRAANYPKLLQLCFDPNPPVAIAFLSECRGTVAVLASRPLTSLAGTASSTC